MKPRLTRHKPGLFAAVAALTLTACAGGVTVSDEAMTRDYEPNDFYFGGTGGNDLETVVVGDPFDMPKDAFEAAVLASLEGRNMAPILKPATGRKREDGRRRHMVLAFNPTTISRPDAMCAGSVRTAEAANTSGGLTVTGVYCSGNRYLTHATAHSDDVSGPDAEQFRKLMTQLVNALFPPQNRHMVGADAFCVRQRQTIEGISAFFC